MQPATTWGGNYSRFTFNEVKRYFYMLKEQGVPVVDDEFNLSQEIAITLLRRLVQDSLGDGAAGDAFKIVGTGANNNFTITGGDGTADGSLHFYLGGYLVVIPSGTTYALQEIAPPALTTPAGARVDEVYIDIYMDEVDPVADPAIVDPVLAVETSRRLKLYWKVLVAEGGAVPAAYTDAEGRKHFTDHLATITRTATAAITAEMVVDARRNIALARSDDFSGHIADGGAHGATSSSTANAIVRRDAAGRAKVAAPSASDDIARKDTVDTVQTSLNSHAALTAPHSATSAATADRLMLRDAAGRAKVAAPLASDDIARKDTVDTAIANLLASAPGTLDTLNELAAALGNDPNFATTITNALAGKAPLASPALSGAPTAPTAAAGTNTTQLATTAFVQAAAALITPVLASYFESGEMALATAGAVNHGLGSRPTNTQVVLRCVVENIGYAIGDEVDVSGSQINSEISFTSWANATQIGWASRNTNYLFFAKTGEAAASGINGSSWRVVLRAWR